MKTQKNVYVAFSPLTKCSLGTAFVLALLAATLSHAQLTPSADAYTNTVDPTTNYGAKTLLDVDAATQITYIQFNLSSIPAGYTGADIAKATLKLYVNTVATAGSFNVDYVNGTWAESTITSSLAPALGSTIAASVPITTADKNQFVLIDVTGAVQAWVSGTANDGIALVANGTFNATFDSKESTSTSHAPELDIVFAGGTLTGVTTASGSGLMGGGTSGTLNLGLTSTCTAHQVLQWNGTAWACATLKGSGTITAVTAGTDLTGGGTSGKITLNLDTTKVPQLSGNNSFTGNQTVSGTVTATSFFGDGTAVTNVNATSLGGISAGGFATTGGTNYFSVSQVMEATLGVYSGSGDAVDATVTGGGSGVSAVSDTGYGAWGISGTGIGVFGTINGGTASGIGVYGEQDYGGTAVVGYSSTGYGDGVDGYSSGGDGLYGSSSSRYGVYGASGSGLAAVYANDTSGIGAALYGYSSGGYGVWAVSGSGPGVRGASTTGDGVLGVSSSGYAGDFFGDVDVTGTLYASAKNFKIDHPLDPANKYLLHTSVESSEMMNIYTGNVTTDERGEGNVRLPEWFEALNADFRYQLTVIGQFAQAIVAREIENHQFQIRTNLPNVKVSWQVTGVRQDAYAKAHPLVVEEQKDPRLQGFYIHPELYGAPLENQIEWGRNPELMKRGKELMKHTNDQRVAPPLPVRPSQFPKKASLAFGPEPVHTPMPSQTVVPAAKPR